MAIYNDTICIRSIIYDAEAETPILRPPDAKSCLICKDPDVGKDWGQEEKGMTEDEMVGWHHQLNGHGFGRTPGVGDGQGGLACCSSWGCKESDMTKQLNWTELNMCNINSQKSEGWVKGFSTCTDTAELLHKRLVTLCKPPVIWECLLCGINFPSIFTKAIKDIINHHIDQILLSDNHLDLTYNRISSIRIYY